MADKADIIAEKDGDYIKLTGTFKGKEQRKTYKIIVFYSIGTGNNRGAMGLGEFAAKKIGEFDRFFVGMDRILLV